MTAMLHRRHLPALATGLLAAPALAQGTTEIAVHYAQPVIFKESYDAIAAEFAKREPTIRLNWMTTPNYEEGMQLILRQAATNQTVDLSYQGFNRLRLFAERQIAQDLSPFLAREGDPARHGYTPEILALGRFGGIQAGLAYAASTPVCFFNADLVRRAGGNPDAMPTSWDGMIELSKRIEALGGGIEGMYYAWPGDDWMFSALLFGHGGRMLTEDERDVGFAGPEGLAAVRLLDRMVKEGGMPNLTREAAQQAFAAGRLGMFFWTTAAVRGTDAAGGPQLRAAHHRDADHRPRAGQAAHGRRRRHADRPRRGQARGGVEVPALLDQRGGHDLDGPQHRLRAHQPARHRRAALSGRVLPAEPVVPGGDAPVRADGALVRLPRRQLGAGHADHGGPAGAHRRGARHARTGAGEMADAVRRLLPRR
jgi:hypothetical protein